MGRHRCKNTPARHGGVFLLCMLLVFLLMLVLVLVLLLLQSPSGFDKTGPYRARFILEALHDLRGRLREAGSELLVRIGKPGEGRRREQGAGGEGGRG